MKPTALDKRRRAAFGPRPVFVAARRPSSARGQVARGLQRNPSVRAGPAHQRLRPRAAAAPPFSGPRSRGATQAHNGQPRHHGPSAPRAMTPRMGPAPGGTTTALLQPKVARHVSGRHWGAGAGGSGYGRRPHSRCHGSLRAWPALMALRAVDPIGCPASVGRRAYPGPPALARSSGWAQPQTAPQVHQPVFPSAGLFHASPVAHGAMDH
jgi:hypothetical protein